MRLQQGETERAEKYTALQNQKKIAKMMPASAGKQEFRNNMQKSKKHPWGG